jgi:hypothetical protein
MVQFANADASLIINRAASKLPSDPPARPHHEATEAAASMCGASPVILHPGRAIKLSWYEDSSLSSRAAGGPAHGPGPTSRWARPRRRMGHGRSWFTSVRARGERSGCRAASSELRAVIRRCVVLVLVERQRCGDGWRVEFHRNCD